MPISYTAGAKLRVVPFDQLDWDVPLNENTAILDAIPAIGWLKVTTTEQPSASLNVKIAAGGYGKNDGTQGTYAGVSSTAVSNNATTVLYLDASGALQSGVAYPSTTIIRLATVVASGGVITSVVDDRIPFFQPYVQQTGSAQAALTDSTGGTVDGTVESCPTDTVANLSAACANNFAELAAKYNKIRTDLVALGLWKGSA